MSARINVNVNNFSTPFSTQVNTIAARNEERRLERIYGESAQPQKTNLEEVQEGARAYTRRKAGEVLDRAHLATNKSLATILFENRSYTLPPVHAQNFSLIYSHGDFDQHFGGLGISKKMVDWFYQFNFSIMRFNTAAHVYNTNAVEKAKGGILKKKMPPPLLVIQRDFNDAKVLFNRKLKQLKVAARLEVGADGAFELVHPSSASGDLLSEMMAWKKDNWLGVVEKPWNDALFDFPRITKSVQFTSRDAALLESNWQAFLNQ